MPKTSLKPLEKAEYIQKYIDRFCIDCFRSDSQVKSYDKADRLLRVLQSEIPIYSILPPPYLPYHLEALNKTWIYVLKKIGKLFQGFESTEDNLIQDNLTRWINKNLHRREQNIIRTEEARIRTPIPKPSEEEKKSYQKIISLDQPDANGILLGEKLPDPKSIPGIDELDNYIKLEGQDKWQRFEQYILEDPGNALKNKCHKRCSECNCQSLAISLVIEEPPHSYRKITNRLSPYINNHSVVINFWENHCLCLLRDIYKELD